MYICFFKRERLYFFGARPFHAEMLQRKAKFQNNLETGDVPSFGHMQRIFVKFEETIWLNFFKMSCSLVMFFM